MVQNEYVHPVKDGLGGIISVPGDKSITHRAILLASLAQGISYIDDWLDSGDTQATLQAVQQLGVSLQFSGTNTTTLYAAQNNNQSKHTSQKTNNNRLVITGIPWKPTPQPLYLRHAGTAIRLLAGIMVGQPFSSVLDGSEQLRRRPMKRVIEPLRQMGAKITGDQNHAPLKIKPAPLRGIRYVMPIPSAQVKSAILFASLWADGTTIIQENYASRDHTERMLQAMGVPICVTPGQVQIQGKSHLQPISLRIPGDFSSAAFYIVAGMLIPNSEITIQNIGLNTTRTGLWDALLQMGGQGEIMEQHIEAGEVVGTVRVKSSQLQSIHIPPEWVPRMIDEFPIFMVAALAAHGETIVTGAAELRVKESDRLAVMTQELQKLGAKITELPDGFRIQGPQQLHGAKVDSHDDHRVAMSMAIAALIAHEPTEIVNSSCTQDSFPGYFELLQYLGAEIEKHKY